ncbi:cell division protein ZapA [Sphingomonas sp.]|uniref:cell division protein ZapA n=1 Tax=Sphingomonas sp. TaxID=28214 RepID=UPI001DE4039C|nr:cell division protein ZapA [Sphingomonas sp.]MBX9796566.1 cell division protein ZapA [Sphingomonas sp.]
MAEVTLSIGGHSHRIACADGQEARLQQLAAMLAERWPAATRASGGVLGERAMLFVALMLADSLDEALARAPAPAPASAPAPGDGADPELLARVATRLEALADALERAGPTP